MATQKWTPIVFLHHLRCRGIKHAFHKLPHNKSDEKKKKKLAILIYRCLANPVSCKYILDMSVILPTESRLCQVPCRIYLLCRYAQ